MEDEDLYFFTPRWPVLYLDNHLLALYKPAGLLVQGDQTRDVSLLDLGKLWLKERYQKPGRVFLGMVHRLDRPVAGVVLFCRTSKAASRLSEQFRSGRVIKKYLAVVEGELENEAGELNNYVERDDRNSKIVPQAGERTQTAKLSYRLLDTVASRSLVEIHLHTGRRHQIRLQLSHIGHPVLGDMRYGASAKLPLRQIALYARELKVIHPTRGEQIAFVSPLPRGWPWSSPEAHGPVPPWNWDDLQLLTGRGQEA